MYSILISWHAIVIIFLICMYRKILYKLQFRKDFIEWKLHKRINYAHQHISSCAHLLCHWVYTMNVPRKYPNLC